MTSFSERHGYRAAGAAAQVESMDAALRNGLWNCVDAALVDLNFPADFGSHFTETGLYRFGKTLWRDFYKLPIDEMPRYNAWNFRMNIKEWFMKSPWYRAYDLVEFIAQNTRAVTSGALVSNTKQVMDRELAGYTFIVKTITPIANANEVAEIEQALRSTARPVSEHLYASLAFLSDREQPNYRKSVDESILAVEAAVRILIGKPKAVLSDGLKELNIDMHGALKEAFLRLYGYASDESAVRHSLLEGGREIDQPDARYMLIICSAFVNYLRAKSKEELT